MTVLLLGVAADTTNCSPTPPVYEDGRFEYIPIPESEGPEGTMESKTYGNTELRHGSGSLAEYVEKIRPGGQQGEWVDGTDLADWPLHHDPNFDALTYGETFSRPDYVNKLRLLEPGDVVAFYTGLLEANSHTRDRYIIGHFTVQSILDLRQIRFRGRKVALSELPLEKQTRVMEQHTENAHAKRFFATGRLKAKDDGLIIVDGKRPGGLLEQAVRISKHRGRGHHYLTDEFQEKFSPEPGGDAGKNAYLGGIKKAHVLNTSPKQFREVIE